MSTWKAQVAWVRRAMGDEAPVTLEELLMLRDLEGRLARQMQPPPGVVPREAAALLLLYPRDDELWLPLTVRSAHLPTHSGQVSLPGGAMDPEDSSPAATALREAEEELGIPSHMVDILGTLASFYIPPSNFRLTPVVGLAEEAPELRPNPHEVELAFSVPLRQLLDPATVFEEEWERGGMRLLVPYFALEGHKVWGATALLLSELVARLRRAE